MTFQPEFKAVPLRRFYMPPDMVRHPHPEISGSEANHICRVLRLSVNDTVELFDGTGNGYHAAIVSATPQRVQFRIESPVVLQSESPVHITLAQPTLVQHYSEIFL
jgi:16S rRNA (uracil1498-N3)-methyltransferase